MLRKLLIVLMSLSLCWTTVACGSSTTAIQSQPNFRNNTATAPQSITDGKYPVQQATYDDATGEYSLMLLNTPPGIPPVLQTANVQMARLDDEAIKNGEKTYLQVENKQPILYVTEDFRIEYVHNVTETRTDTQTGQPQTVVVRQESNFWTPFAGALAGQAVASMLFRPQYYVPPVYSSGGIMTGYGGYGTSYTQAVNRYQERYSQPPAAVRNRQTLRTTGSIRTSNRTSGSTSSSKFNRPSSSSSRSSGSGVGSSTLRTSNRAKSPVYNKRPGGFGSSSGSISRPRSGFGSSRGFSRRR
jgi:hypothetical protein